MNYREKITTFDEHQKEVFFFLTYNKERMENVKLIGLHWNQEKQRKSTIIVFDKFKQIDERTNTKHLKEWRGKWRRKYCWECNCEEPWWHSGPEMTRNTKSDSVNSPPFIERKLWYWKAFGVKLFLIKSERPKPLLSLSLFLFSLSYPPPVLHARALTQTDRQTHTGNGEDFLTQSSIRSKN